MPGAGKKRAVAKKSVNRPQKAKGITAGRARPAGEVEAAAASSNDVSSILIPPLLQSSKEYTHVLAALSSRTFVFSFSLLTIVLLLTQ